jgi:hypothetical protein
MRRPAGGLQRCGNEFPAEPGVALPPITVERECRDGFEVVGLAELSRLLIVMAAAAAGASARGAPIRRKKRKPINDLGTEVGGR